MGHLISTAGRELDRANVLLEEARVEFLDAAAGYDTQNAWDCLEDALAQQRQAFHNLVVAKFAEQEGLR